MQTKIQTLPAGQAVPLTVNGSFFMLLEAASPVNITFLADGGARESCEGILAGFRYKAFSLLTGIVVTSDVDQTIKWAYSMGEGGYDRTSLIVQQCTAIADTDPVAVADTVTAVLPGDGTRKAAVFLADENNAGRIAIGGAGVTLANAVILLEPGEDWADDTAAAAAWYAIAETDGDSLRIQERR